MAVLVIEKYLSRYSEPETQDLSLPGNYEHCLVIPATQESADSLRSVWQDIPSSTSLLVIVVINAKDHENQSEAALLNNLLASGPSVSLKPGMFLVSQATGPDLLLIDRYSENRLIDSRQGVGLARKIGADIALKLWQTGYLASPWLRNTDADAILPANYFTHDHADATALLYPFRHVPAITTETATPDQIATSLYDLSLLYYPAGLSRAGSPYAFPTIGSTLCCRLEAYAQVRGFPRRNAAEDFYLLNKLRKVGAVLAIDCPPITLSGRRSTRVPVGTGQAIASIAELPHALQDYQFEHPQCFEKLRELLLHLEEFSRNADPTIFQRNRTLKEYSEVSGLDVHIQKLAKEQSRPAVRQKSLMDWFDALRTRQFIHHVRDRQYGTLPLLDLARHFNAGKAPNKSIQLLRRQCARVIYQ